MKLGMLAVGLVMLAGQAGAQRASYDRLPIRIEAGSHLAVLAEIPRYGAIAARCGIRDEAWLTALHQGVENAIADEVGQLRLMPQDAQTATLIHWGAAAMARLSGERTPRSQEQCAAMGGNPTMQRFDALVAEQRRRIGR